MSALPSVFVSHGPPTIAIDEGPAPQFLAALGRALPRPEAILCVSAHWETEAPAVLSAAAPPMIYDFYGFPDALYEIVYPAPGATALAARAAGLLEAAGIPCAAEPERGYDHGTWTPLRLAYPDADVPITQLSIQHHLSGAHHVALGRALAPLREEGVLIFGSGNVTHNLRDALGRMRLGSGLDASPPEWASNFADWTRQVVERGDLEALGGFRDVAPDCALAHPRDEHFLPLLVAAGAGGGKGRTIHESYLLASLSMAAYAFGEEADGLTLN